MNVVNIESSLERMIMKEFFLQYIKGSMFLAVIALFLFVNGLVNAEEFEQKRVVKVAFPQSYGLSYTNEDGSRSGVVYEWLMEIAKYTHWEYEFITEESVNATVKGMFKGKYDLMGAMLKMPDVPETQKLWYYPDYLMGFNYSTLLYNKNNENIKSFDISTFNHKTIGVYSRATKKIKRLQNILDFNGLDCTLKYYDDVSPYNAALDKKEVDMLLAGDA